MDTEKLDKLGKQEISPLSRGLSKFDVEFLVKTLSEKDDKIRYNAFLLLQANSKESPLTYKYWEELERKLEDSNSYQRSIGLMLIAENIRWNKNDKFNKNNCQIHELLLG